MAAMVGADGTPYITQGEVRATLLELFNGVHGQMVAQNTDTQGLIAQLREDVQQAIVAAKTGADEQVESLRGHTRTAVSQLDAKLEVMDETMTLHEATRKGAEEEFQEKMKTFEKGVHDFADRTALGIQTLISDARSPDGSSLLRPNQKRDRPVLDPRDYRFDAIPSQMSLGVWKNWRHEVEMYVNTIGPSWRGVKLVLQQARPSAIPLLPTVPGMHSMFQ